MAQIAGLSDMRGAGPPGDIGVFQGTASIIVYQFTFSGVTYIVAQRMGVRGWTLVDQGIVAATVIQATINSAITGCTIHIKPARYVLTASIIDNGVDGIILEGEGDSSELYLGNGVSVALIALTGVKKWEIRNLAINGNKVNNPGNWEGIDIGNSCDETVVHHCYVTGISRYGIFLNNAGTPPTKCIIHDNRCYNIYVGIEVGVSSGNKNHVIANNICWSNTHLGIGIGGYENVVTGNQLIQNGVGAAADGGMDANTAYYNTITGNLFYGNNPSGFVDIGNCGWNTFSGNTLRENTVNQVLLKAVTYYWAITGNVLKGGSGDGLKVVGAIYCTVTGNIIMNAGGWGINCSGGEDYCAYGGNVMRNNASGNTVNGEGANSKVWHNIGDATHIV